MTQMTIDNQYAEWEAMLADGIEMVADHCNGELPSGRYKTKMGERFVGVAVWRDGETVHFIRDGRAITDQSKQLEIMFYCRPITEEQYEELGKPTESGDPVYSELPDNHLSLLTRVTSISRLSTAVESDADEARLADMAHVLGQISSRGEALMKAEQQPHKDAIAEVKGRWDEVIQLSKAIREPIMAALTRRLMAKNEKGGAKGQLGRAISLRTSKVLDISDYEAALAWAVGHDPEAFDAKLQTVLRKAFKDGHDVPGAKMIEERKAA